MVQWHAEKIMEVKVDGLPLNVSPAPQSLELGCPVDTPTPGERMLERQGLATKEIVIRIRSRLDRELAKAPEFRSRYYREALNYLGKFWMELFAYLDNEELPRDNNLAERTIRKLTTLRNNSFHYRSDVGVGMAATYHRVISTVKLHGHSVWDFSARFSKKSLKAAGTMLIWFLARLD